MATRATQTIDNDGLVATYHAATTGAGDQITPGPGVAIHVKNAHSAETIVTIVTPGTVDGLAVSDRTVTVAQATEQFISVPEMYRSSVDGLATITWSVVTAITFAVIRIN